MSRRAPIIASLRSGTWLSADRARVYPAMICAAFALASIALVVTARGNLDVFGRPLGIDFSGIWVAGREVLAGAPTRPYDHAAHAAAQQAAFGTADIFLPWPYPPLFLPVAAALGRLPYLAALALWQGITLALYAAVTHQATRGAGSRRIGLLLAALSFPAVAINLMHGQNGLLTAALLGAGGLLLPHRPVLAGIALGLLVYKPQFALMWPLALLAGWHWRAILSATVTAATITAATVWAYGMGPWHAFVAGLPWTRIVVLERGGLESYKLNSAFAAMRLVGGSLAEAYAVQLLVAVVAAATLVAVWRQPLDGRIKLAGLATATLLATPYSVDYDLTLLGPALAALAALGVARGFGPYEVTALALVWVMPFAARPAAMVLHLPLGFIVIAALHAYLVARAFRGRGSRTAPSRAVSGNHLQSQARPAGIA